tara:strand:+ start:97 stop:975 length:879 start_codon:yes stop_codon:yes gene_type:complete
MATETQTYTYDPTQDTLIDEANEARDAENLEVGEKLVAEQENLLAGKYKNAQDLEQAYIELQKKLGDSETKPELESIDKESTEEAEPQYYTEDGSVNYETAKEVYGDQLSDVFQKSSIDPFAMNEYFQKNDGTLTDEMYEQLSKAGLNKSVVDSYLEGVRQQSGFEQPTASPRLTEAEVIEVKAIAGGTDGYESLMNWASENLADSDAKNFDDVIETGNKAAVTFAVKALMGQYEDSVGRDSTLIQGKSSSTGDVYRSMAEVVRDMNNPMYDKDPAVRQDVQRKLERSNLNV